MEPMRPVADGYGLIEGPVWHPTLGLIFSDVINGGVFHLDPTDRAHVVFPYRRGIGGMVLHEQNGLVVSGRNIAYKEFGQESSLVILDSDPDNDNVGYNDITADSQGRIYAGSLGSSPVFDDGREPTAGNLHLIDVDGTSRIVAEDILLTNGLGFSPDGTTLYHSDSRRGHVVKYATKPNGELGPKKLFAQFSSGAPDGLAVAQDGSIWVALAGGGGVCTLSPAGEQTGFIPIPLPMCTSVCFGGDDMKTLYIVTGSDGVDGNDRGAIFRHTVSVPGLAVPAARIDILRI
ncbi:MAG: SMP-30/gluconolactonase/LRE family protein [Gammaproteobacteria bacterium]|nr:SMP-30/gluconolactonase/LRE family protein [Gammaproteobacteria bacterium]